MSTADLTDSPDAQNPSQPVHGGLSGRTVLVSYLLLCVLLGVFHLILGADEFVVFSAVGSVIVATLPALRFGWRDLPSLFCMLFGFRYATTAIVWKLFELNPLDEGLYAPQTSFNVIFVGMSATALAVFVAHIVWPIRPVFIERLNAYGYAFLLVVSGVLGTAATVIGLSGAEILGGVRVLLNSGLVIFPMAYMGYNIYTSRSLFSPGLLAVLLLSLVLAFSFNSRQGSLNMLLAVFAMYVCFGFRLGPRLIAIGACLGIFFSMIVAPAMVDARAYREVATPIEMIGHTVDAIQNRLAGNGIDYNTIDPKARYRVHYVKANNQFVERAVSVQQLDFLVALAASNGEIGTERFWAGLYELLPSALAPNKTIATNPSYALIVYGIFDPGTENRTEVTPYGSAFSYGGFEFLFFAIFAGYFIVFFLFRMFCPTFRNSILAAFTFAAYIHPLSAGDVFTPFLILRSFPFEAALFWVANLISGKAEQAKSA